MGGIESGMEERVLFLVQHGERKHSDGGMSGGDVLHLLSEEERAQFGKHDEPRLSETRGMHMLELLRRLTQEGRLWKPKVVQRCHITFANGKREERWYHVHVW